MILFLWVLNFFVLYEITCLGFLLMNLPNDAAFFIGVCTLAVAACLFTLTVKLTINYLHKVYKRKDFKL